MTASPTHQLRLRAHQAALLLFLHLLPSAVSQVCDTTTVTTTTFTDLTTTNTNFTASVTLAGDAATTATGTSLTSTAATSHGGFFLNAPTAFQATGGFSAKFALNLRAATASSAALEFIVASEDFRSFAPGPYGPDTAANGLAGWSRASALVVEFDSVNSGASEQDDSTSHIAIFLAGVKRCSADVAEIPPSAVGGQTVWLDYDGFATRLDVRLGAPGNSTRPDTATLSCVVDVWAALDIAAPHHVGFAARNDGVNEGVAHTFSPPLSIADAYRPFDSTECATYARCAPRVTDTPMCLLEDFDLDGNCLTIQCNEGLVWDVSGTSCCAFIEKSAWTFSSAAGIGPFLPGQLVQCEQKRRIVGYLSTVDRCV